MENQDFIITSLQSWDIEIGSTIKNTTLEISKKNRVVYVNPPLDYSTWLKGKKDNTYKRKLEVIKGKHSFLRQINNNLWVIDCPFIIYSINQLPTAWLFDYFNKLNNKKIATHILLVLEKLHFHKFIHIIDTDIYRSQYLKEYIKPALSIYYCRDFVIGTSYWKKNGSRLEPLLAAKSDIVLANSSYFSEHFKQYNSHTYTLETGVDLKLYDINKKWVSPLDILDIKSPIIGYVGSLTTLRLDVELLYSIAQELEKYNFVFVGPEDNIFIQHPLHSLKNVFFLGAKDIHELPAYINSFDVCINPQMINEITIGNYPLKIDEYLAMGKPTVATATHTMQDIFSEYVFLASNKEEYIKAINQALMEINDIEKKKKRVSFAHTHSWSNSVNKIYQYIKTFHQNQRINK
ncbi:glycosyltransferase [Parabacteroides pacaensis]|uniref:glycosyltransferase n=1 Tax=Parabacteroides pacaensis TaxID=2086575 RepID=UPI000D0E9929|nr:glycosyltransferase [Parabacteroides pacaensis]